MDAEQAIDIGKGSVFYLLAVVSLIGTVALFVRSIPDGVAPSLFTTIVGLAVAAFFGTLAGNRFHKARSAHMEASAAAPTAIDADGQ